MKTGKSKISNLPYEILEELNYRICDGEPGNEIVAWLNDKPEVAEIVKKLFDGVPISEQNLCEWRKRGHQIWLLHHNSVDESTGLTADTADIIRSGVDADKLLLTLTAAYADMIRNWVVTPREEMTYKLGLYKNLTNSVLSLQRAEVQKLRKEILRERLIRERRLNRSAESSDSSDEAFSGGDCGGPGKGRAESNEENSSPESTPRPDGSEDRHSSFELRHSSVQTEPPAKPVTPVPPAQSAPPATSPAPQNTAPPKPAPPVPPLPLAPPPIAQNAVPPKPAPAPAPARPSGPPPAAPKMVAGLPLPNIAPRTIPNMAPGTATQRFYRPLQKQPYPGANPHLARQTSTPPPR